MRNLPKYDALYEALALMVAETIEQAAQLPATMSTLQGWSSEFRTVRFGVGRQMGHSTAAARLVKELAPNDNPARAVLWLSLTKYSAEITAPAGAITRTHRCRIDGLRGMNPWIVVVDMASRMPAKTLKRLQEVLAPADPLYILM